MFQLQAMKLRYEFECYCAESCFQPSTPAPEGENGANVAPEQMPQSHFAYHDINVISYEGLAPHLQIKQNLPLFQVLL